MRLKFSLNRILSLSAFILIVIYIVVYFLSCQLLEDAYAVGDSMNDLPMLLAVPNSIAMGGAENIYPYVSYVTTSVSEDGIYNAMKHFNLV